MTDGPRPLQRLVMVTGILAAAGPAGRPAGELADAVGFRGTPESRREQLARCIRDLQAVGVDIANVAARGQEALWVLRPRDSRIRLAFTPEQQAELARAALLSDRDRLVHELGPAVAVADLDVHTPALPVDVDPVLRAVTARCALRFGYNGRERVLDPVAMQRGPGGWAVSGVDRAAGQYRTYYLARMSDVATGPPGSARDVGGAPRRGADPLSWQVDPPLDAVLQVAPEYERDVAHLLGPPRHRDGGESTYLVTNRWAFFARLVEVGERVRLVAPEPLRIQFADFLREALP